MGVTIDVSNSYRLAFSDGICIASEEPSQYAFLVACALHIAPLDNKTIAWIGGGFCVGPTLFSAIGGKHTIYEIEPDLAVFCPNGVTFILGDYRATLAGVFDVIIYDLGGEVPRSFLTRFLTPNGIILPKEG